MKKTLLKNLAILTALLVATAALAQDKMPLKTQLPRPLFVGTPVPLNVPNLEPRRKASAPTSWYPPVR